MFKFENKTQQMEFNYPFATESIREIEKHTKYDKGQEEAHFDEISTNYEAIQQVVGYPDPEQIAEKTKNIALQKMIARSEALVADFGCGTGLVGQALNNNKFEKIVGVDCSEGMLQEAEKKDVYTTLEKFKLGGDDYMESFPNQLKNKFDFVTAGDLISAQMFDENILE